jgi:phage terminase Nu1 subunit (DNA packaging protein)
MKKVNQVNGTSLAVHLDCTRETVNDYVAKGIITKLRNGKYDQDDCRNKVFAHLRDKAAGRTGDLVNERALLAKENRETATIKNQLSRGQLVRLDVVERVVEGQFAVMREVALTLPGKVSDQVSTHTLENREQVFAILDHEVREMLETLSTGDIMPPSRTSPPSMPEEMN